MWPFKKKVTLADSGLLNGLTDNHSHLLPGVDDGFKSLDDTLRALALLEEQGVSRLWLTPHIMEDIPNKTDDLRARFENLKEAYANEAARDGATCKGSIELNLAAEYMLDNVFLERLEANDLLTHDTEGKRLLVETSYFNPPRGFHNILTQIEMAGYRPILAHPERYTYMDDKEYRALREKGIIFQVNYGSLLGFYGKTAAQKAQKLLEAGMVSMLGGDLHSVGALKMQLDSPLPARSLKFLSALK